MSNDVKIYRSYGTKANEVVGSKGKPFTENLSVRVETMANDSLENALDTLQKAAVRRAWDVRKTGLLANSIFYVTNKEGKGAVGLNSMKGTKHRVKESYVKMVSEEGLRLSTKKGVATGFVGTMVSRSVDATGDDEAENTYSRSVPATAAEAAEAGIKTGEKIEKTFEKERYKETLQYAPFVEYGTAHTSARYFMRGAVEDVRAQLNAEVSYKVSDRIRGIIDSAFGGGKK